MLDKDLSKMLTIKKTNDTRFFQGINSKCENNHGKNLIEKASRESRKTII